MTEDSRRDRLHELLADRALVGLSRQEERELIELFALFPDLDVEELDRVAAACALASLAVSPMPAGLADKLAAQAPFASRASALPNPRLGDTRAENATDTVVNPPVLGRTLVMSDRPIPFPSERPSKGPDGRRFEPRAKAKRGLGAASGWIAAAACLLLAIGVLAMQNRPLSQSQSQPLADQRTALIAKPGSTKLDFAATADPAAKGATGDVVWNEVEQKGFMRFRGLAKNDPKSVQYQLWIFDKERDDRFPVDGGVFDVDKETGDVIVPIRATLAVKKPVLFAVTAEQPGGVVVSKRERIVIAAKPAG